MSKTIIFIISCLLFISSSFAEICPSINEIKNNRLHGWTGYDLDNGIPVNQERMLAFRKNVKTFFLAEWADQALEGSSHCYYNGDSGAIPIHVFLAKANLLPAPTGKWHKVVDSVLQCKALLEECIFQAA